jgi:hypothetical protein
MFLPREIAITRSCRFQNNNIKAIWGLVGLAGGWKPAGRALIRREGNVPIFPPLWLPCGEGGLKYVPFK